MEAFIERRQASRAPAATDAARGDATPPPAPPTCLGRVLEQIDYGTVLVDALGHVRFLNGAGRRALHGDGPLRLRHGRLEAAQPEEDVRLRKALAAATGPGLRTLLAFGPPAGRLGVSVVPIDALDAIDGPGRAGALVMLGRPAVCEHLSAQWFAREHGLTNAEAQVLCLLCDGAAPAAIADRLGVAMSTVRTQIGSIRAKTGAANIGALVRQVSMLPPMVSALSFH